MKKLSALLLSIVMIFSVLVGCSGNAATTETTKAAATTTTAGTKTGDTTSTSVEGTTGNEPFSGSISMLCGSTEAAALELVLKEYQKINPDVNVEFTITESVTDFETLMTNYIASNTLPDMYCAQVGAVQQGYAKNGYLYPLTDTGIMDKLIQGDTSLIMVDNDYYAFPMALSLSVVLLNLDTLDKYNVSLDQFDNGYPTCWADFISMLQQLKDAGLEAPYGMAGMDSSNVTAFGFQYIYQVIYGEDPNWYANILSGKEAWNGDLYKSQFTAYKELSQFFSADCLGVDVDTLLKQFVLGESAAFAQTAGTVATIRAVDPTVNILLIPPCFTEDPADQTTISGFDSAFSITKNAQNIDLCVDFLDFITSNEGSTIFNNNTSLLPTTVENTVELDPAYDLIYSIIKNKEMGNSSILSRQWIAGVKEIMKTGNQNWLAGDDANAVCDEIESEHKRLMDADPKWVEDFLTAYEWK